jgi:hypothetical protein
MRRNRVSMILTRAVSFPIAHAFFCLALCSLCASRTVGALQAPAATANPAPTPPHSQDLASTQSSTGAPARTSTAPQPLAAPPQSQPETPAPTEPQICSRPVSIAPPPTQGAVPAGKLSIDPTQIDLKVFDDETASLSVVNLASTPVQRLRFSTLELFDGKTGQHISAYDWDTILETPLGTNQRMDCHLVLNLSNHAGAYTGTLRIDADNGYNATAPLTIRIRGPYFPVWRDLPLICLTLVFGLGWGLSMGLDYWFTVRWPLLEEVVVLKQVQEAFGTFLANVATWETNNQITLINTDIAVAYDKSDLDTLLLNPGGKTVADLQQSVERFATSSALNDEFYTALQIASAKIPKASLSAVATQLDNVNRNQPISAYRVALLAVLKPPVAAVAPAAVAPAAGPAFQPGTNLSKATAANLHQRAVLMDHLKTLVLALVVWLTAYTVYYAPNPSFGTAVDYIALFLWSLGLTATGSQIVNSVKKP